MLVAPGKPGLWRPLRNAPTDQGRQLSTIPGLSNWWDAGTITGLRDPSGTAIAAFGAPVGSLSDMSGVGAPLAVWHWAGSAVPAPVATPRLNSLLGGIGRNLIIP